MWYYVSIKGLHSRILVYLGWSWYLTWASQSPTAPPCITAPSCFPDWAQHLFPSQGDFARNSSGCGYSISSSALSSEQIASFKAIVCLTLVLHRHSHLLTDRSPRTQIWQCSTSLFSLTYFHECSKQAFINSKCLLFCIPLPYARQSTYAQCNIWGDELLTNKSRQQRHVKQPNTSCQGINQDSNECGIPTTCNASRLNLNSIIKLISYVWILSRWIYLQIQIWALAFCLYNPYFSLLYIVDTIVPLAHWYWWLICAAAR